jgi:hypothetical protein
VVQAVHLDINTQGPGSSCKYVGNSADSGKCDGYGWCQPSDTEEDALDQLYWYYRQLKERFSDWCNKKHLGISNKVWFVLGGIILLVVVTSGCFYCNHVTGESWEDQL